MADEEDVALTSASGNYAILLHQENVDKDVDRVGCVRLGRSMNSKVLASVQFVHAGTGLKSRDGNASTTTTTTTTLSHVVVLKSLCLAVSCQPAMEECSPIAS